MTDPALDLPGLRRQFAESVETLGGLEERLRSISLSDEAIAESSSSLSAVAGAIGAASSSLEGMTTELRASAAALVEGMSRVDDFLAQADMAALDSRLDEMSASVGSRLAALEAIFDSEIASAKSEIERLEAELSAVRQAMSARQLKKLDESR